MVGRKRRRRREQLVWQPAVLKRHALTSGLCCSVPECYRVLGCTATAPKQWWRALGRVCLFHENTRHAQCPMRNAPAPIRPLRQASPP